MICLSETFLSYSFQSDDYKIFRDGYNLIKSDRPSDSNSCGFSIYYENNIPLIKHD